MYYYPNMIGGTEHSIKLLADGLVRDGNNVSVYTLDGSANCGLISETIDGVKIYRRFDMDAYLKRNNKGSIINTLVNKIHSFRNYRTTLDLNEIINQDGIDVIHTNNVDTLSYYNIWKVAKDRRIPCIHTIRDYFLQNYTRILNAGNKFYNCVHCLYYKKLTNNFSLTVTAPSSFVANNFINNEFFLNSYMVTIPNAIVYEKEKFEKNYFDKFNKEDKVVNFLYVGALTKAKGIAMLLKMFHSIDNNDIRLNVCGKGELRDFVLDYAKKDHRIKYLGQLTSERLSEIYLKSDVLVVPSLWEEPFGRIIIEGAYYGIPTIGSNRGGIPEIIDRLKTGSIFNPDNPDELVELMNKYSERCYIKNSIKFLGESIECFSLKNQIDIFERLYINCLEKNIV